MHLCRQKMSTVSFILIGYGHIGKRHARVLEELSPGSLKAVIDTDSGARDAFVDNNNILFFSDISLFETAGIAAHVAVIALPNGIHCEMACRCIRLGMHVVIEKPMGLSSRECAEVIALADSLSRHVFVVKQNRYSPPALWMKKLISDGTAGRIYQVHIRCFWNRDDRYYRKGGWRGTRELDGGVLFTQFSHFIDVMYWIFGDIDRIHARFFNYNHADTTAFPDSGMITFDFVKGGQGSLQFSTSLWDRNMESSMTVIAEKGSFRIGGQYMDQVEYIHIQDYVMPELEESAPPNDYGAYTGSASNHHYVLRNVLEVLSGKASVATNGREGMKIVEIIERIYASGD
jgi:UDP-N-acetyl-2-amino-2-deoxyglucuronate dehydrogenase